MMMMHTKIPIKELLVREFKVALEIHSHSNVVIAGGALYAPPK